MKKKKKEKDDSSKVPIQMKCNQTSFFRIRRIFRGEKKQGPSVDGLNTRMEGTKNKSIN